MSAKFPTNCCGGLTCPTAKQIIGSKQWKGWAGSFQFPGFRGNWVNTYGEYGEYTGGAWQDTADGGAIVPPDTEWNFAAGDLVVQEIPAAGPITDYLTGLVQSYPKCYIVYICTGKILSSATRPSDDGDHFAPWDFQVFNVVGGTLHAGAGQPPGGPSGWPISMGQRMVGGAGTGNNDTTTSAQLELTMTTELDNFPLMPATISGLTAALGSSNDAAAAFADATVAEASASGTFVYDWTFANEYDGTAPTYTPPGTTPSAEQAQLIFPGVPYQRSVGYQPTGHWSGDTYVLDSVFMIDPSPPATYLPNLVTWLFSSTSVSFKFAAWTWNSDVEYSAALGHFGALATARGTITQTLTLGGAAYTLATVASQAATLRDAVTFDSMTWGTSITVTWNPDGSVHTAANIAPAIPTSTNWLTCAVGTEIKWAAAVNYCIPTTFTNGNPGTYTLGKALVQPCAGNYCLRDYAPACASVTCATGVSDGVSPVALPTPSTPGEVTAIYNACTCT